MLKFAQTERVRPLHEERVSPEARSRKKQRMQKNRENNAKNLEIVVEPEKEEVMPEKEGQVKLLFEKFDSLKKADEDFNSFLEVVSKDIAAKTDRLKKVKVRGVLCMGKHCMIVF